MNGDIPMISDLLNYNAFTGEFFWKCNRGNRYRAGEQAGHVSKSGYVIIGIGRKYYKAHRLAWLLTYGKLPDSDLDHVNRDRSDNRIVNLRECSPSQNQANRSHNKNNSTGHRGVCFHKRIGKFQASIRVNWKPIHLGTFDTAEAAADAYSAAALDKFGVFTAMLTPNNKRVKA